MLKLLTWFTVFHTQSRLEDYCRLGSPESWLRWRLARRRFIRGSSWCHIYEGKGRKQGWTEKEVKLWSSLREASAANMFPSEIGMTHQNCPKLEWDGWVFISPNWSALDKGCPGKGTWPWMRPSIHPTSSYTNSEPFLEHWPKLSTSMCHTLEYSGPLT